MAMRTASPWWASLAYIIGLAFLFIGERVLAHSDTARLIATGIGTSLVLAITGMRVYTTMASTGSRRRVERTLLFCHLGGAVALLFYALTTKAGMGWIGLDDLSSKGADRYATAMTVLWPIILVASLVPMVMIEVSLGAANRDRFDLARGRRGGNDEEAVEYFRVRDMATSGLSLALAAALLMVTCNVAGQKNLRKDVSYFRTSSPGESTLNIVKNQSEPLKVLVFFPEVNQVKEEVLAYFETLASQTGKVTVESHDHRIDASLAQKYKVTKDGIIVIVRGDKNENLEVDTDLEKARRGKGKLRNLDREVNAKLMKLVREKRKVYLTVGHGEMTDPDSLDPQLKGKVPERRTTVLKKRLGELNYESKELGLIDLAQDVPEDAQVVMMIAPSQSLRPEELAALGRYLDRGGRLLVAVDPRGSTFLGSLEGQLGVAVMPGFLTDDKAYFRQRGGPADRRWVVTTQFSAHASTTTLSRAVDKGLLLIESGALKDVEFTTTGEKPKRTYVIRSMESAWLDLPTAAEPNGNFSNDPTEKRERANVAAAIEGPKLKNEDGSDKVGFRAMVFADSDLFADVMIQDQMVGPIIQLVSGPLLDDAMKWLGGEEVFAGDVVSEDDVPIKHTKNEDAVWFQLTIFGAPLLVLGLGLTGTMWRRRRSPKTKRQGVAS